MKTYIKNIFKKNISALCPRGEKPDVPKWLQAKKHSYECILKKSFTEKQNECWMSIPSRLRKV